MLIMVIKFRSSVAAVISLFIRDKSKNSKKNFQEPDPMEKNGAIKPVHALVSEYKIKKLIKHLFITRTARSLTRQKPAKNLKKSIAQMA